MLPPIQLPLPPLTAGALNDSLLRKGPSLDFLNSSSASLLLFRSASSKSTRSLHCSSIDFIESCKARSVSVLGCQLEGILYALW